MNKMNGLKSKELAFIALAAALCFSTVARAQTRANTRGEQFFIISSVDFQRDQIVLMHPTQLTVVATFSPQTTTFLDENGQKLSTKDLRAGDTVWAVLKSTGKKSLPQVSRIREGAMTVAELHKLFLDYPSNGPVQPLSSVPIAPATPNKNGLGQPQPINPLGVKPMPNLRMPREVRPEGEHRHPHEGGRIPHRHL